MRSERYNIYDKAHNRLRSRLLDAGLRVQAAEAAGPGSIPQCLEVINQSNEALARYLDQSSRILEAVVPVAPYIALELEKNNNSTREMIKKIDQQQYKLKQVNTWSLRKKMAAEIQQAFFELTAAALRLMNREEMIISDLLWNMYSDEEIRQLEKSMNAPVVMAESLPLNEPSAAAYENYEVMMKKAADWSIAEELVKAGAVISSLLRTIISPDKWSFANRVYTITRPYHLFVMMQALMIGAMATSVIPA